MADQDFDIDMFLEDAREAEAKEAREAEERAEAAEDEDGERGGGLDEEKKAEEVEIVEGESAGAGAGSAGAGGGGGSNPSASKKAKPGGEKGGSDVEWRKIEDGLGDHFKWVRNANAPGVGKTQIIATLEWSERHRVWCLWCKKFYAGPLSNIRAHCKNSYHTSRAPALVAGLEKAARGALFSSTGREYRSP